MSIRICAAVWLCVSVLLAFAGAQAWANQARELNIIRPHAFASVPGAKVASVYMEIINTGDSAYRLTGAAATFAGRVEIHNMTVKNNVMRMRKLAGGIEIAPRGRIVLSGRGMHIMFMELRRPLVVGETLPLTLLFEKADPIQVELAIVPR